MPSWGQILSEITGLVAVMQQQPGGMPPGPSPLDIVRRKYLAALRAHTGRAAISYSTRWSLPPPPGAPIPQGTLSIGPGDIHGFMEAMFDTPETELDLLIHSPGGSAEAADAIVQYLRVKFRHIRVIVPQMAMSAATMIACAADQIVMGAHSFIGPIDPQLVLTTAVGPRYVPAQAIVEQFALAQQECADPSKVTAWLPMLAQYGPDLIITCKNLANLARQSVSENLAQYMFSQDNVNGKSKAEAIATWLADHSHFKTHSRFIGRELARSRGLNISNLEDDPVLQDAALSCHHATAITFANSPAVKIIENAQGKTFMDQFNTNPAPPVLFQLPAVFGPAQPPSNNP